MTAAMTPKERMLAALNRREPDRVPSVMWGSYYTFNDDTYFNLLAHLGLGEPVPPFRKQLPRNSNHMDDRVLDALQTDARYIWSGLTDLGGARMDGDCRDAWGVEWVRQGPHLVSVDYPLAGATMEQIEGYDWPDPERYLDYELMAARLDYLQRRYPNFAIGARAANSYGPFEQAAQLRGRVDFLMDIAADPQAAKLVMDRCADVIVRAQELYLAVVGQHIDFFEIPGDDYGANQNLMISPKSFRTLVKPALARIVASVKAYRADLPVVFHTDGAIASIVPDLAEIGIDVLNPLEPLPATDWAAIKAEYGDQFCFMGGVDVTQAMIGSVDDVRAEVSRCIDLFGPGGGYVLTSANHLQSDVPPENIVALFEAGREYGRYPLGVG
jgi:uroporphyrinogen decarboxylase